MSTEAKDKTMPGKVMNWLRVNWREETNVGKAKIAAIPVAIFILVAFLWPSAPPPPLPAPPAAPEQVELVPGIEDLRRQAAEAYESYEARIGQLSEERRQELGDARLQVAEVYRDYERRIAELEQENAQLARQVEALKNTLSSKEMELLSADTAVTAPADSQAAQLQEKLDEVRQQLQLLLKSLP